MNTRSSGEAVSTDREHTPDQRKKEAARKRKKQDVSGNQPPAEKERQEQTGGRRKKHPISLRPTNETYELSETMANQRGKDRSAQDHSAYANGLIVEAVSGPAIHGMFGTLSPEELDERVIPLYIALGGYLKRRGKLPLIFGEGFSPQPREFERQEYRNGPNDGANQSTQSMLLALDEEAETAFSGGPGPS